MSVSFYPTVQDSLTQISCACGAVVAPTLFASRTEAYNAVHVAFTATAPVCGDEDCAQYSASFVEFEETPMVNVSNTNAMEVLDVLGIMVGDTFNDRCVGSMNAELFLGRVLMASAVQLVDAGVPVTRDGNMFNMGRAEGYLNARVEELRAVAEYSVKNQLEVCWA